MHSAPQGVPFEERGGRLRGVLDLISGRYPAFLFGGSVGRILPVFHFHEARAEDLEPKLTYLAENGYTTVTSAEIADVVFRRRPCPPRAVALAFDDGWASLWTVAAPLLRRYRMRAITYVIPARIEDAAGIRPVSDPPPPGDAAEDRSATPLATWPELRELSASGVIDVQSHTWSHTMMFSGPALVDFVSPRFGEEPPLNHPRVDEDGVPRFLRADAWGAPLFERRSRMSDGLRFFPDPAFDDRCRGYVAQHGGRDFFTHPAWREELTRIAGEPRGRIEDGTARQRAIEHELAEARAEIETRLATRVEHICLPWGVAGSVTRDALRRTGHITAFANRMRGRFAVAAGDDPYALKRLPNRYITALPGHGRRHFLRP